MHFVQKTRKKYRKVWYLFKKPAKRFEGFIGVYTRGIWVDLRNPPQKKAGDRNV